METKEKTFNPDQYETPDYIAEFLADRYLTEFYRILEPSAGTGNIACWFDTDRTDCIEIDTARYEIGKTKTNNANWFNQNFLTLPPQDYYYDLIIGNPPYGDAVSGDRYRLTPIEFIKKATPMLSTDGVIVFLLESDYFRSKHRSEYFDSLGNIYINHKIDIIGRLKFLVNGEKTKDTSPRYHSIFEFTKTKPDQTTTESIKL